MPIRNKTTAKQAHMENLMVYNMRLNIENEKQLSEKDKLYDLLH